MAIHGFADVVVGIQWGDEGKAKLLAYLLDNGNYALTARFNGGSNAGHTVYYKGHKVGFHQLPSGVFCPDVHLYSGSGVVTNPVKYSQEIKEVESIGNALGENFSIPTRLRISGQSTVVQPHHIILDGLRGKRVATTGNGIGPAYVDQAARMNDGILLNIRMIDLKNNPETYLRLIQENLERVVEQYDVKHPDDKDEPFTQQRVYPVEEKMLEFRKSVEHLSDMIDNDPLYVHRFIERGGDVLFEGANGGLLDRIKGTVPNVTSSHTTPGSAFSSDLPPNYRRHTYGVLKAIPSRVGRGSFPGEYGGRISEEYTLANGGYAHTKEIESEFDALEELRSGSWFRVGRGLRIIGDEYGTTTKRPRRLGRLDLVLNSFAIRMLGVDRLVVTKADLLKDFGHTQEGRMPVVIEYVLDGRVIDYLPTNEDDIRRVRTRIEYFDANDLHVGDAREYAEFPAGLRHILQEIHNSSREGCQLYGIGVGPETDDFILRRAA